MQEKAKILLIFSFLFSLLDSANIYALSVTINRAVVDSDTKINENLNAIGLAGDINIYLIERKNKELKFDIGKSYLQTSFSGNATKIKQTMWQKFLPSALQTDQSVVVKLDVNLNNALGKLTTILASYTNSSSGQEFIQSWNKKAIPPIKITDSSNITLSISFINNSFDKSQKLFNELKEKTYFPIFAIATAPYINNLGNIYELLIQNIADPPTSKTLNLGVTSKIIQAYSHILVTESNSGDTLKRKIEAQNNFLNLDDFKDNNYLLISLDNVDTILGSAGSPFSAHDELNKLFGPFIKRIESHKFPEGTEPTKDELNKSHTTIANICQEMRNYGTEQFNFVDRDLAYIGLFAMSRTGNYNPIESRKHLKCFSDKDFENYGKGLTWDFGPCGNVNNPCNTALYFLRDWYSNIASKVKDNIKFDTSFSQAPSIPKKSENYSSNDLINNYTILYGNLDGSSPSYNVDMCVIYNNSSDQKKYSVKTTIHVETITDDSGHKNYLVDSVKFNDHDDTKICDKLKPSV